MEAQTVQIPVEVQERLKNLEGFKDLLTARTCYMLGRKAQQKKMNKATKKERGTVSTIRKTIRDNIPAWIAGANVTEYETETKALVDASKIVTDKSKPFRDKISPLTRAMKYIDTIAVPASLKLLGVKLQPRFSLSKFMEAELEKQKNK